MPKTTIHVGQQTFTKWERYDKNKALLCFFDAPDAFFNQLSTYYTIYHQVTLTKEALDAWEQERQEPFGVVAMGDALAPLMRDIEGTARLSYCIGVGPMIGCPKTKTPFGWITGDDGEKHPSIDVVYHIKKAKDAPQIEHPTLFLIALRQLTYQLEQQ